MIIEYATTRVQRESGDLYTYAFTEDERAHIAAGLEVIIKRLEKKIERIDNNRYNEGQATYATRKSTLRFQIEQCQEIINQFTLPF